MKEEDHKKRVEELSKKPIWEMTAEEFLEVNSPSGYTLGAMIQVGTALMALKIERVKNEPPETRKAILRHGL